MKNLLNKFVIFDNENKHYWIIIYNIHYLKKINMKMSETKEKIKFFKKEKVKKYYKLFLDILLIGCALYIGYISNDVYKKLKSVDTEIVKTAPELHKISETSVAINERNELMIINRETGEYEIYQDSIGEIIFKLYSNKIYENIVK